MHHRQDGNNQTGIKRPKNRFTDNGDGTITDIFTGLVWLKEANCIASSAAAFDTDGTAGDGKVTWQHAQDFVNEINAGTYPCNTTTFYTDWRLPNVREVQTLIDFTKSDPALPDSHPFTGVLSTSSDLYWTSTSYQQYPTNAWLAFFHDGATSLRLKTQQHLVWVVR